MQGPRNLKMIGVGVLNGEGQEGLSGGTEMYFVYLNLDDGFMHVYIRQNSSCILQTKYILCYL